MTSPNTHTRTDHDLIGDRTIPADAYWGVHALRAQENFPITGITIAHNEHLVTAIAMVKQAAARANKELGLLAEHKADAIDQACQDIINGHLRDQFIVDQIQGGAGTSTNMNANEVIANRALEILGHPKGDYKFLHPNDDVNLGQSTNDVYPTACRIATILTLRQLETSIAHLEQAFDTKADEFYDTVKMGRTQLQDAVPMTLGQEFGGYAETIREDRRRLTESGELMLEINIGATAIGTGLNADSRYRPLVVEKLRHITGLNLVSATNLIEATWDTGAFVHLSGVLKRFAVKLSKVFNDLRLLSSGPRAGLGEITLPAVQSGSSIMPGKVNPVIPEVVNQVAFEVIGNDLTITLAAEAGQLELNAFEPIIVHSLTKSMRHLEAACRTLADRCVSGITAHADKLRADVEHSIGLVTALAPVLGYATSTEIAKEALVTGASVVDVVLERGLMSRQEIEHRLQPELLANLRTRDTDEQ